MKKFLIFLVSIVIVVSIGLTTFYFLRNDEVITVGTKEIYCNVGDTISLDELNIKIKKSTKRTTFNYNAGGEDVTKYINYDKKAGYYVVSKDNAGDVVLVIGTSNKKYSTFTVNVHIGNGSVENPYYIFNETDLSNIGKNYLLDKSYALMSDIVLTSSFKTIGYNATEELGFSGNFNGNGHKISGLKVTENKANAGLFSTINTNGVVTDLIIDNVTMTGSFDNAGALAGTVDGTVKKVQVSNVNITNNKANAATGALAGKVTGSVVMSYATNATVTAAGASANLGGFVGELNKGTIQACYTSAKLNLTNSGNVGGFVGNFVVGNSNGTIQQSYANTECKSAGYGAFVGNIDSTAVDNGNMLRHLVGNMTVTGKDEVVDEDLVANFDHAYFNNTAYVGHSAFYDADAALYLVRGYKNASLLRDSEYVFYAMSPSKIKNWDTDYIWKKSTNELPTLRLGSIEPTSPVGSYFRRNLAEKYVDSASSFITTFNGDKNNENIHIIEDADISEENWIPVALTNTTVDGLKEDGTNAKITVNLANAKGDYLGLFSRLDNCTIKNLDIIVVGVNANSTYFGGLAGVITSSVAEASSVENVNIKFNTTISRTFTYLGGIAGLTENTIVENSSVVTLALTNEANVANAGGLVSVVNSGEIRNNTVDAVLYATSNIGGVVANNAGSVLGTTGNVVINANNANISNVGGIVATNNATVANNNIQVKITISNSASTAYIGGVAGSNAGSIENTKITGDGIAVDASVNSKLYIGGIAALNNGTITDAYNLLTTVGTYTLNKDQHVGGVVAINNGTIVKAVASSNVNGNYVAGVAVYMNNNGYSPVINQVLVGKYAYNSETQEYTITKNTLTADKYVAGIVFDLRYGTVSNVQAESLVNATTNNTRASLITLIAPRTAKMSYVTVDSSFSDNGIRYRDTWTDFDSYKNKEEFYNYAELTGRVDNQNVFSRFSIYQSTSFVCEMTNVVVNTDNDNASKAMVSETDYDYGGTNFVVTVNNSQFNDSTTYKNTFTFKIGTAYTLVFIPRDYNITKTLTFEIGSSVDSGSAWISGNGINLTFISNVK